MYTSVYIKEWENKFCRLSVVLMWQIRLIVRDTSPRWQLLPIICIYKKKKSSGAYRAVGIASSMIEDKPYVEVV